jgi:hypothetical protein
VTISQLARDSSIVNRLVGLFESQSWRWQNIVLPCAYPECKRRSVQYSFARRLDGVEVAGQWLCSPPCYEAALLRNFTSMVVTRRQPRAVRKARLPLGLMFLSRGELTEQQLSAALEEHRSTGARLGDILLQRRYVTEQQVTSALAAQWGHPTFPSNSAIAWLPVRVPLHLLELHRIVPLHFVESSRTLLLGFADGPDHRVLSVLQRMLNCSVDACFITMGEYQRRLQFLKTEKRLHEVVFDRVCPPAEIARICASYVWKLGSRRIYHSICGEHLWVRLAHRHDVDLLFRHTAPA